MVKKMVDAKELADRFAWEIERRILSFPIRPEGESDFRSIRCEAALVLGVPLVLSTQDLVGSLDEIVFRVAAQLNETAELLKTVSDGCRPVFLAPPEKTLGLEMSEHGHSGEVDLRLVRGYSITDNTFFTRLAFRCVAMRWQR